MSVKKEDRFRVGLINTEQGEESKDPMPLNSRLEGEGERVG